MPSSGGSSPGFATVQRKSSTHFQPFVFVSTAVWVDEPHADTVDRAQVPRLCRRLAELAAQPRDVDVDSLVTAAVGLVPDICEELPLGHDPPEVDCQVVQQVELLAAQKQVPISERGLTSGRVDPEGSDRDRQRFRVLPYPAQDRPETRLELPGGEWLDDVVVGSRVEGLNDLAFIDRKSTRLNSSHL